MTHEEDVKRPEVRRTFSRKNRTILVEERASNALREEINDANFAIKVMEVFKPTMTENSPLKEELSDEEDEEGGSKKSCLKNVHELLESGTSARLYDELEYLIAGLESLSSTAKASREGYLLDLGKKLFFEPSAMFESRLRSSGMVERIIKSLLPVFQRDDIAVRFLIVTLHKFCSKIRRIDHFISLDDSIDLSLHLMECPCSESSFLNLPSHPSHKPSRMNKLFEGDWMPQDSLFDLGIWILSKSVLAKQTSSLIFTESILDDEKGTRLLDLLFKTLEKQEMSSLQSMRIVFLLRSVHVPAKNGYLRILFDLSKRLMEQGHDDRHVLLESSLALLVSLTGSDEGSLIVAREESMLSTVETLILDSSARSDNVKTFLYSLAINIADRHVNARKRFKGNRELIGLLRENSDLIYEGILLGIIYCDDVSNSPLPSTVLSNIRNAFERLIGQLQQTMQPPMGGKLVEELRRFQSFYLTNQK